MGASIWIFLLLSSSLIQTAKTQPYLAPPPLLTSIIPQLSQPNSRIPTASLPLLLILLTSILSFVGILPPTSLIGHLAGALMGYLWGAGWIKFLAPPEKVLRWVEGKLNLLGRIPHYVSVDQKVFGRYGILPQTVGQGQQIPMV